MYHAWCWAPFPCIPEAFWAPNAREELQQGHQVAKPAALFGSPFMEAPAFSCPDLRGVARMAMDAMAHVTVHPGLSPTKASPPSCYLSATLSNFPLLPTFIPSLYLGLALTVLCLDPFTDRPYRGFLALKLILSPHRY